MDNNILLVDKYAPKHIEDMLFDEETRKKFSDMVKNNSLPSMTLIGKQGSGKTSIAKVLTNEMKSSVLFVPCATDGTIDVVRTRIRSFCESMSFENTIKIVILDEIDSASNTGTSNFQKSLRTLIEEFQESTRFILTANYENIEPAVLSRCPKIKLGYDKKLLVKRIKYILDNEKIEYDIDSLKKFIEKTICYFPDIRRTINYLQSFTCSGKLVVPDDVDNISDDFIKEFIEKCKIEKNVLNLRQYYISNKAKIDDYLSFSSSLFNCVVDNGMIDEGDVILKMSNIIYQMNLVIDKEIQFFALVVLISKNIK